MKVLLTGAAGMLGSSIVRAFGELRPDDELVGVTRADVDLADAEATRAFVGRQAPDAVIHAAAYVAGVSVKAREPDSFLAANLRIDESVFTAAVAAEVPELLYISSSVIYPFQAAQPIPESSLFDGPLEPINESYGLAKLVGTRRCAYLSAEHGWAYRAALPSNLYGPGDDYRPGRSHLAASALAKVHAAKVAGDSTVDVWGDGTARREFTYAPDLAAWLTTQIGRLADWPPLLNVGSGQECTVRECYEFAARAVGWSGEFRFDTTQPTGIERRVVDSTLARALGWAPATSWSDGFAAAYTDLLTSSRTAPLPTAR